MVYLRVAFLSYRFMDVFSKRRLFVSINPSCKHNYINVDLTHTLKVLINNICSTQVDGEHVQVFKDLKINMDKYVLHSYFHIKDMDNVDLVLGHPWIKLVGTININVENKFLKLW